MTLDPSIPIHAKNVMNIKIKELEEIMEKLLIELNAGE